MEEPSVKQLLQIGNHTQIDQLSNIPLFTLAEFLAIQPASGQHPPSCVLLECGRDNNLHAQAESAMLQIMAGFCAWYRSNCKAGTQTGMGKQGGHVGAMNMGVRLACGRSLRMVSANLVPF